MSPTKPRDLTEFADALLRIGTKEISAQLAVSDDEAARVMRLVVDGIISEFARFSLYVPVGFDLRNAKIWRAYGQPGPVVDGTPGAAPYTRARIEELAVEHELTSRQIYNIVSEVQAAEMARRQPRLPGLDDGA